MSKKKSAGKNAKKRSPKGNDEVKQWRKAGLAWLDEAPHGAHVTPRRPRPRPVDPSSRTTTKSAEKFGRRLAHTHLAGAPGFGAAPPGWQGDGWFGSRPMPLPPQDELPVGWGEFFATWRVMPAAREALAAGHLDKESMGWIEQLCHLLVAGRFDDERPASRLHGDLWTGNVVFTAKGVALTNPSAHGGHAETDIATLRLFATPHLEVIEAAWAEVYQPRGEWRERAPLHQLHTILNFPELFSAPRTRVYYEGRLPHLAGEIAESFVNRWG